jgi:hypothetical protein
MLRRFVGKGFLFALTVNLTLFLPAIKAGNFAVYCFVMVTPHAYMMCLVPLVICHLTTFNHFGFALCNGIDLPLLSIAYDFPLASLQTLIVSGGSLPCSLK